MCLTGREVDHLTHIIDRADAWGINYLQEVILAIYLYPPNPLYLFPAEITVFTFQYREMSESTVLSIKQIMQYVGSETYIFDVSEIVTPVHQSIISEKTELSYL